MMDKTNSLPDKIRAILNFTDNPFQFETNSNYLAWHSWMRQTWSYSLINVAIYLAVLALLNKWMRNRAKFELRMPLVFWNVGLALFSTAGTVRTLPELVRLLSSDGGFHRSVCDETSQYSPVYLTWVYWFGLSKVPELGDTIFIILRKRPLTFLHVYHHCTVLVFSWYVGAGSAQIGRWYCTMNFFIHSLLYCYYAFQALKWFKLPRMLSMIITFLQTTQMAIGIAVNLHALQSKRQGVQCDVDMKMICFGFGINASYFVLFVTFFYGFYLVRAKKQA